MSLAIGPNVPRRGNFLSRGIGHLLLRIMGWKLEGAIPDLPKMVLIGAPHTSNTDGVIAIGALSALGIQANTMIKSSAFSGLFGKFLTWLGAIPVDRANAGNIVAQSVSAFEKREQFFLLIAPEGTRTQAETWKRGFQRICVHAKVPLLPAACDYRTKVITFGPPFYFTENYEEDFERLMAFYAEFGYPKHLDRMSGPIREALKDEIRKEGG